MDEATARTLVEHNALSKPEPVTIIEPMFPNPNERLARLVEQAKRSMANGADDAEG